MKKTRDKKQESLGEFLRNTREEREMSLRSVAREAAISPPYLSDIEHDRRVPSEDVLEQLGRVLGFDPVMVARYVPRLGREERDYLKTNPSARDLLWLISSERFNEAQVGQLIDEAYRLIEGD